MSQGEILKFLSRNPGKWYSTKELKKKFNKSSINDNLRRLYRYGEVLRKEKVLWGEIKIIDWKHKT